MKRLHGLLKKEFALMKGWLYGTLLMSIVLMAIAGVGTSTRSVEWINNSMIFGFVFLVLICIYLFIPMIVLLESLKTEWQRADIWLHSPSTIFQLFGSKVLFSGFVGLINIGISVVLFLVYAGIFGSPVVELSFNDLIIFIAILVYSFYTISLLIMCLGLFFRVLYHLIKPTMNSFAMPVLVLLFIVLAWTNEKVKSTVLYEKITTLGPIGDPLKEPFYLEKGMFFIGPTEPVIYSGEILLSLVYLVILFVVSAVLFERKVRL